MPASHTNNREYQRLTSLTSLVPVCLFIRFEPIPFSLFLISLLCVFYFFHRTYYSLLFTYLSPISFPVHHYYSFLLLCTSFPIRHDPIFSLALFLFHFLFITLFILTYLPICSSRHPKPIISFLSVFLIFLLDVYLCSRFSIYLLLDFFFLYFSL